MDLVTERLNVYVRVASAVTDGEELREWEALAVPLPDQVTVGGRVGVRDLDPVSDGVTDGVLERGRVGLGLQEGVGPLPVRRSVLLWLRLRVNVKVRVQVQSKLAVVDRVGLPVPVTVERVSGGADSVAVTGSVELGEESDQVAVGVGLGDGTGLRLSVSVAVPRQVLVRVIDIVSLRTRVSVTVFTRVCVAVCVPDRVRMGELLWVAVTLSVPETCREWVGV
mmetsp:Transcript_40401/g.72253  ORF Transcript_40401/g.72253 Transcript_40401/m.72253 type:complete len:223 (+) Transcript_40401:345-1013(+)